LRALNRIAGEPGKVVNQQYVEFTQFSIGKHAKVTWTVVARTRNRLILVQLWLWPIHPFAVVLDISELVTDGRVPLTI
jgi:hypothetical protein